MLRFNRLPKNKKFDYKPRYYDPEAEERARRKNPKLEKGSFSSHRPNILLDDGRRQARVGQNLRIFLIMGILIVGVLYFLEIIPIIAFVACLLLLLLGFSFSLRKSIRR